jgi:MoaA/NifB/PqqE/SkfB family radical SAM enzyme
MSTLPADPPSPQTLQIELTSRCNLSCQTCLRAAPEIQLQEQDLSRTALQQLQPALSNTELVHLQGWGETMLLDDLPERINWFQSQGCKVSFTTNGSLMSASQADQLVSCGLDSITFSMAGATASTQDSLRGHGTHSKLWNSLHLLHTAKQNRNSSTPALAVSYLLTPETIMELPLAVKQCRHLGLTLFACVHLTHAATRDQLAMQVYSKKKKYKKIIRQAYWQAFWGRMQLQLPPFKPVLQPICDKNPLSSCFIAADGAVAPCVFLYPPVTGNNTKKPLTQISFGSLSKDSLETIWQNEQFQAFRKPFKVRLKLYEQEMAKVGVDLDGIDQLERAKKRIQQAFTNIPVPECCSCCAKIKGF